MVGYGRTKCVADGSRKGTGSIFVGEVFQAMHGHELKEQQMRYEPHDSL